MNRRNFIRKISTGAVGFTIGALPYHLLAADDYTTISILHTNDIHGHIEPFSETDPVFAGRGGIARIAEIANHYRNINSNTLLLDAGDMFQGTPYFNYYKGNLILKVMSAAGYDAGTLGNHEFDNGLAGILEPLPNAKFPLINSNYDFSDTILNGKFPRWKIFRRSGIKIGVYGLGIELKGLVDEKNFGYTQYLDPLKVAVEMESFLKNDKNCDLVICLSHLGLRYKEEKIDDLTVASETSFTDLIVSAHTHTFLENPIQLKNKKGMQVIINQAGWGGLMVGKVDFIFGRARRNKKIVYAENLK